MNLADVSSLLHVVIYSIGYIAKLLCGACIYSTNMRALMSFCLFVGFVLDDVPFFFFFFFFFFLWKSSKDG